MTHGVSETGGLVIRDNPDEQRYEAVRDGKVVGFIDYVTASDPHRLVLVHTEVDPSVEGAGVGSQLVAAALDDIHARGLGLVPACPFVSAYLRRHPQQSPADVGAKDVR